MNNQTITLAILLVGIMAMIFPAHAVSGQIFLTNEQQQLQNQPQQLNPNFMSFEQFMQYMFYYEKMFGKDYVTKIYKEYHDHDNDDDDDDRDKKKHRDKDWWKHNSVDLWKDKKKYCEGKGEWNGKKCVTDNEEDKTAWEDAVCDNNPGNKKFCGGNNNKDDDNDKKEDIETITNNEEIQDSVQTLEDEEEEENAKEDYDDSDEGEEEQEDNEPEEEEEESDSDDSDDSGDSDDGGDGGGDSEEG